MDVITISVVRVGVLSVYIVGYHALGGVRYLSRARKCFFKASWRMADYIDGEQNRSSLLYWSVLPLLAMPPTMKLRH